MALHVLFMILKEKTDNPFELASKYTGVSVAKLHKLHEEFQATGTLKEVQDRRGRYERQVHWSRHWIYSIREIVTRLNTGGMPVTIKRIQKELNLSEYCLRISDTTIRKILKEIGFTYGDTGKAQNFVETLDIVEWRDRYLKERINTRSLVERGDVYEVWLDESYCNQHHVAKRSWFREGDVVKRGNKGRRWVILHAGGRDGWCGTPCVFQASSSSKDYHDNMNGRIFEQYFRDLCGCLLERGQQVSESGSD
jgi:transposase